MKKLLIMVSFAFMLFHNSNVFAIGIGPYIDLSTGSGEAEWDSDIDSWDIDANAVAGGFVLDTSPADERTFNYRLNVGFARQNLEDDFGKELESNGIYIENIFGFALVKRKDFRWWAGPLVRVGYYSGEVDSSSSSSEIEIDYAEFGLGAVMGLNFSAGKAMICPSIGFRVSGFAGEGEFKDDFGFTADEDIEGNTTTVFANVAVLF